MSSMKLNQRPDVTKIRTVASTSNEYASIELLEIINGGTKYVLRFTYFYNPSDPNRCPWQTGVQTEDMEFTDKYEAFEHFEQNRVEF